jgi:hypothetical protein
LVYYQIILNIFGLSAKYREMFSSFLSNIFPSFCNMAEMSWTNDIKLFYYLIGA